LPKVWSYVVCAGQADAHAGKGTHYFFMNSGLQKRPLPRNGNRRPGSGLISGTTLGIGSTRSARCHPVWGPAAASADLSWNLCQRADSVGVRTRAFSFFLSRRVPHAPCGKYAAQGPSSLGVLAGADGAGRSDRVRVETEGPAANQRRIATHSC